MFSTAMSLTRHIQPSVTPHNMEQPTRLREQSRISSITRNCPCLYLRLSAHRIDDVEPTDVFRAIIGINECISVDPYISCCYPSRQLPRSDEVSTAITH